MILKTLGPQAIAEPAPSGQNPIDYFVDQKLQEIGLKTAGVAEVVVLVRRLTISPTR